MDIDKITADSINLLRRLAIGLADALVLVISNIATKTAEITAVHVPDGRVPVFPRFQTVNQFFIRKLPVNNHVDLLFVNDGIKFVTETTYFFWKDSEVQ